MVPVLFTYQDASIRTCGTPDNPLFSAVDVCRILEIDNVTTAVSRLDSDESTLISKEGDPNVSINYVTESGLYALILGSRKPQSKAFKRWITHDVIPAIRKTGKYETGSVALALPQTFAEALRALADTVEEKEKLVLQVAANAPKVEFAEAVQQSDDTMNVGAFAKSLGWGPNRLFAELRARQILYYRDGKNLPYQEHIQAGRFKVNQVPKGDRLFPVTTISGKGMVWLAELLKPAAGVLQMEARG